MRCNFRFPHFYCGKFLKKIWRKIVLKENNIFNESNYVFRYKLQTCLFSYYKKEITYIIQKLTPKNHKVLQVISYLKLLTLSSDNYELLVLLQLISVNLAFYKTQNFPRKTSHFTKSVRRISGHEKKTLF